MQTIVDPEEAAAEAGLTSVHVDRPGYTRHRAGKGFYYRNTRNDRITDEATLKAELATFAEEHSMRWSLHATSAAMKTVRWSNGGNNARRSPPESQRGRR